MSTKKHEGHPHLTGEHKFGDTGQLVLFLLFLLVWILDSFVFEFSTFLKELIPLYLRLSLTGLLLFSGWYLARRGIRAVFGTQRDKPELIAEGVFRLVRHPIYTGALLFYLAAILSTLSLISGGFYLVIIAFYFFICRYEEKILTETFGNDYLEYKKKTGMLFPKLF
jgi:protein-S-isoprenylcysteine O-methyltransferase Ste14